MAQMNNYFWVDAENRRRMIDPNNFEGEYCLSGIGNGREGFEDGRILMTSPVVSNENNIITTESGSKYQLGEISPDYLDYLDAVKNGIPIISSWDFYSSGNPLTQSFWGKTTDGLFVRGEISEQNGNYITFKSGSATPKDPYNEDSIELNNSKFFVIWCTWQQLDLPFLWYSGDLQYPEDFEEFANYKCKPKLFK